MNLVPARIDGATLHFGQGAALALPGLPEAVAGRAEVIVGIRPETFSAGDTLRVQPLLVEHTGSDHFLNFRLGDTPVTARLSGRAPIPAGPMGLDVDLSSLRFFDKGTGRRVA
jgi:ABC-type sugar transport system ATPase subunit